MYTMLDSHMCHTAEQFAYVQGQITALSSQIDDLSVNHDSDSESAQFQPFGHSGQKGGENFKGELRKSQHSVRGSISLDLETLVIGSQAVYLCLIFSFYNYWFMFMLVLFLFKTSAHDLVNFSVYSVYCVCVYLNACVAFSLYFQILLKCLEYFTLVPSVGLFLDAYTSCILHWLCDWTCK